MYATVICVRNIENSRIFASATHADEKCSEGPAFGWREVFTNVKEPSYRVQGCKKNAPCKQIILSTCRLMMFMIHRSA